MTGRILAGFCMALLSSAGLLSADDSNFPDAKVYDKLVVDSLRDVHNKGADLFNESKDFMGTYRMYQGALLTVKPLLAHRPAAQKLIAEGLAAAEKELTQSQKAFKLHETIEAIRTMLRTPVEATVKKEETKRPTEKKPTEPGEMRKMPETKPTPTYEQAPLPRVKKTDDTIKPKGVGALEPVSEKFQSGKVVLRGQPVAAGEVTVVTLNLPLPRVFTASVQADGAYRFQELLPTGNYVAIVNAQNIPVKYRTTTTSGLTFEVKPGGAPIDLNLQ
jgi:hypothetical protein